MEAFLATVAISFACLVVVILAWRVLDWVWLKPNRLEKRLKEQGFQGNPYRLFYGDTKERDRMLAEAKSKPLPQLCHDHLRRIHPFVHQIVNKYGIFLTPFFEKIVFLIIFGGLALMLITGKKSMIWNGPVPMVMITEPEVMRQVLMKMYEFQKPTTNPFLQKIATGLVMLEGEQWAYRRKLINPAFHMDKLQLLLPAFYTSTYDMIKKWEEMTTSSSEIDAWSHLHRLSADVISRAAFGSSYEEGRRIFELITEQLVVAIPVINAVYVPGWR
ncbi:hypothetical protein Cgig2_000629 [Carnegiea gigantea]|uniref:Cytochrome P450 n=1 Tax=Carnegiea gigantea TaxID=171969 RepID=A0A9Q1QH24_9CARY|nr:hypothetical protein Cgig2_000629 [Carnegiea gigantea]